jgi:heme a synthase
MAVGVRPSRLHWRSRDLWLHRFALVTTGATFLLIVAGGLVTSTGAGLAVPDWPTTFGHNMFLYPWSAMGGGVLVEHSHRLIGAAVGLLTALLAVWLWIGRSPGGLRWLGAAALGAVIVQGVIGGLRVVLLERSLAVVHAAVAQAFFALMVSLAFLTSPERHRGLAKREAIARAGRLGRLALLTTGMVYAQLVIGAVLRHTGVGLVFHLLLAAVVAVQVCGLVALLAQEAEDQHGMVPAMALLVGLLVVQVLLGVGAYLGRLAPVGASVPAGAVVAVTTAHVVVGALMLANCVVLTLRVYRPWALWGPALDRDLVSRRVPA